MTYFTAEVCKILKISRHSLYLWLDQGVLPQVEWGRVGGMAFRVFSEEDLEKLKSYQKSLHPQGWPLPQAKGRGRPRKTEVVLTAPVLTEEQRKSQARAEHINQLAELMKKRTEVGR